MCKADLASNSQKGQDTSILGIKLDKLSWVFSYRYDRILIYENFTN